MLSITPDRRPVRVKILARTALVPVWILVFGLACLVSPPMGVGTSILLLVAGVLVAPVVMIFLCAAIPRLFRRE